MSIKWKVICLSFLDLLLCLALSLQSEVNQHQTTYSTLEEEVYLPHTSCQHHHLFDRSKDRRA